MYEISSHGRLRTLWPRRRGLICRSWPDGWGYLGFVATVPGEGKRNLKIHREVCVAFHGPPPFEGAAVRHFDGDNQNNHVSNLRWGTQRENVADAMRHGTFQRGERHAKAVLTEEMVLDLRVAPNVAEWARRNGVKYSTAKQARRGDNWGWLT